MARRALLVILLLGSLPSPARADSEAAPRDYSVALTGLVFVMLAIGEYVDENDALRRRYPKSGLYPPDGPPRWTLDWYEFSVELTPDGHHLVRHGPWAQSPQDLAVAFYAGGRLLRAWKIDELVRNTGALAQTVSHFTWRHSGALDAAAGLYRLVTLNGEHYAFDLNTGEIVEHGTDKRGISLDDSLPLWVDPRRAHRWASQVLSSAILLRGGFAVRSSITSPWAPVVIPDGRISRLGGLAFLHCPASKRGSGKKFKKCCLGMSVPAGPAE